MDDPWLLDIPYAELLGSINDVLVSHKGLFGKDNCLIDDLFLLNTVANPLEAEIGRFVNELPVSNGIYQ